MPTHFDSIFFLWSLSSLLLCPESGVDCPCQWFHANSRVRGPAANSCQLLSPTNSLLASRYLFRPRRDFKSKNPLSGFAPKQTKESSAWRATYKVLQRTYSIFDVVIHLCIYFFFFPVFYWYIKSESISLKKIQNKRIGQKRYSNWSFQRISNLSSISFKCLSKNLIN